MAQAEVPGLGLASNVNREGMVCRPLGGVVLGLQGSKPGYLGEASDFGEQTVGAGCRGVRELGRQIVTSSFSRGSMCHVESGEERLKPNQTGLSFECLSQ